MKTLRKTRLLLVGMGLLILFSSCSKNRQLIKQLPPDDSKFLSEVRFLITKQEKKLFLNLMSDQERKEFKEEFWKKRDPDPGTSFNEFKEQYYERIDQANNLFTEGKKPGWLTDRGRVYILLGPPETKRFYPGMINSNAGQDAVQNLPHEIWYYGFFPIFFVDRYHNGSFILATASARHIAEIQKSGEYMKPKVGKIKLPMGFTFEMKKQGANEQLFQIRIPYKNLMFNEENSKYTAKVNVAIKIHNRKKKKIKDLKKDYTITMMEKDLKQAEDNYIINLPLDLPGGKYVMTVLLEDQLSGEKLSKKTAFEI